MKDVKITFNTNDLTGNPVVKSYNTYLSTKELKKTVDDFNRRGIQFTVVNSYTGDVLAQSGV